MRRCHARGAVFGLQFDKQGVLGLLFANACGLLVSAFLLSGGFGCSRSGGVLDLDLSAKLSARSFLYKLVGFAVISEVIGLPVDQQRHFPT